MFVTYKITEKSFVKFQKKGISEAAIKDLEQLENKIFSNAENFKNSMRKLSKADEILKNEEYILKISKGFFRLDFLIF